MLLYILSFGCGQKESQETPIQSIPKQESQLQPQKTVETTKEVEKQQLQLVYFHDDFIVSGKEPKYVFVPTEYLSEQKLLDDLYEQGKKKNNIFIIANQPEQCFWAWMQKKQKFSYKVCVEVVVHLEFMITLHKPYNNSII